MRRAALLTLTFALLAATSAEAARPWGSARTPDRVRSGFLNVGAAGIDDRGYIVAGWTRQIRGTTSVVGARRTPRRGFGGRFVLRDGDRHTIGGPLVAMRGRTAFFSYTPIIGGNRRIESRVVRPSGSRSGARVLSGPGPTVVRREIAYAPDGSHHLLGWARGTGTAERLYQVTAAGEDGYLIPTTLRPAGDPTLAAIAVDRDGTAYFAAAEPGRIVLYVRPPGATQFVSVTQIATGGTLRAPLAMSTDGAGRVTVAWAELVPGGAGEERVLAVSQEEPGGSFLPSRQLGSDARVDQLQAVRTTEGRVRVAWIGGERRPGGTLRIATADAGGTGRAVSPRGERVESFTMAPGSRGEVTLLWSQDIEREPGGPVHTAVQTASGRIGTVQRLSDAREQAIGIALAVGPRNDALAMWSVDGGKAIRAARRPASG